MTEDTEQIEQASAVPQEDHATTEEQGQEIASVPVYLSESAAGAQEDTESVPVQRQDSLSQADYTSPPKAPAMALEGPSGREGDNGSLQNSNLPPLPPSLRRTKPGKLFAILLIVCALLIAGGAFLYVLFNPGRNIAGFIGVAVSATPTAAEAGATTPGHAPTSQPASQTTPSSLATPAPARSPALTPTATSSVDATKLSPQQLYAAVTGRTPSYSADMSAQNSGQWDQGGNCKFANAAYDISIPLIGTTALCHANALSVTNFAFQVHMTIRQGSLNDGGGLLFRDAGGAANYRFTIGLNGTYSLSGASLKGSSPAIKTGLNQDNVLTVIAQGNLIFLYVNGQPIAHISATTSSHGLLGLLATSFLLAVNVTFANAKMWVL